MTISARARSALRRAMSPAPSLADEILNAIDASTGSDANTTAQADAAAGTPLTNADETLTVAQGHWRQQAVALTANHTKTLSTTGAVANDQIEIVRTDGAAFTLAVVNGGVGAGTLVTFPASKVGSATFQFDGTNWALRSVGSL